MPSSHTPAAKCENECIHCGEDMVSFKCRCGYWCNECPDCSRARAEAAMRRIIGDLAHSLYRDIEDKVLSKYAV